MFASPEDSEKVVGILLTHGANVNAQGGKYGNALQAASHIGNEKVVKLLLEAGADVDSQGGFHGSAINAASAGGHSGVMQILRDRQDGIAGRNADQPDGLSSQTNSRP
jgi:ankyrin repeat protein